MSLWKSIGGWFSQGGAKAAPMPGAPFAQDLLAQLGRAERDLAFSPESVRMALGMALLCARGATAEQIALGLRLGPVSPADFHEGQRSRLAALRATSGEDPCAPPVGPPSATPDKPAPGASAPARIVVANGVFAARSLQLDAAVVQGMETAYLAAVERLDFAAAPDAARARINQWVSGATRGLIPEIAGQGTARKETRMVIANALYFKAEWATKFLPALTAKVPFHLPSGEKAPRSMMHQTAEHAVFVGPDAEILELAYRGSSTAMTFLLPPPGVSLADFESKLRPDALDRWFSGLQKEVLRIGVPRFTVDSGALSLRQPLMEMGIRDAFGPAADFALASEPLALDDVLHRTRLTVTEEGTEAAAATAMFASQSLDRRKLRSFVLDRPFLFVLRDLADGALLFVGRVTDPRE